MSSQQWSTRLQIAGIEHQCRLKFTVTSFGNLRFTRRDYVLVDICVLSPWTCWELIKTFCVCFAVSLLTFCLHMSKNRVKAPNNPERDPSPAVAPSGRSEPAARWGSERTGLCSPLWFPAPALALWPPSASRVATSGPATQGYMFTCTEVTRLRSTFSTKDKPNFPQ